MRIICFPSLFAAIAFATPEHLPMKYPRSAGNAINSTYNGGNTSVVTAQVNTVRQFDVQYPLNDGFPYYVRGSNFSGIEYRANGTVAVPNPEPKNISRSSAELISMISFNGLYMVNYFTSLAVTVAANSSGWNGLLDELGFFGEWQAQEEIHVVSANYSLLAAHEPVVQPCQYTFPYYNENSSVLTFQFMLDLAVGTWTYHLSEPNNTDLFPFVAGVLGQQSRVGAVWNMLLGYMPASNPFTSLAHMDMLYSAIMQMAVVTGTCPVNANLPTKSFGVLQVGNAFISGNKTMLQFGVLSWDNATINKTDLSMTYLAGEDTPSTVPITGLNITGAGANMTAMFSAEFPTSADLNGGSIFALLTMGPGPFNNVSEANAATLYGPGFIRNAVFEY